MTTSTTGETAVNPPALPRRIGAILCTLALLAPLAVPAQAGMVGTDRVLRSAGTEAQRERLVRVLERDAVRAELEALGVPGESARERVERLTDTEVAQLHGQVASLPAGGHLSTTQLLLIVLLIVLLV